MEIFTLILIITEWLSITAINGGIISSLQLQAQVPAQRLRLQVLQVQAPVLRHQLAQAQQHQLVRLLPCNMVDVMI